MQTTNQMEDKNLLFVNKKILISLLLIISSILINAGEKKIKILNKINHEPITWAKFQYNNKIGTSDNNGFINFTYKNGAKMIISHISYGTWELTDKEVKEMITTGFFYKSEKVINISPITVIALRPRIGDKESLDLDHMDRMSHDCGAILNQIPVISSIRKSGCYGFDPVLRGFKYDQLNIVMNGSHSSTAACPNRMDPPISQMAPNMLDRIEILKGPYSLRYGNSFGGTINFISSPPRFSTNSNLYGRVSGSFETNGSIRRTEGLLGFSGKKYDLGVFGAWAEGDDYRDGNNNTIASQFLRGSFGSNLGIKISDQQNIILSLTRNLTRNAEFPALPMDLIRDDTWMSNATHKIRFQNSALVSWNTTAYGTFVDHLMSNERRHNQAADVSTPVKTYTYGGRTEGKWRSENILLFAGSDLRVESADGTRTRYIKAKNKTFKENVWQDGRIIKAGLFAEYHISRNKFQYIVSGRFEFNNAIILDPAKKFTDNNKNTEVTQLNPSISMGAIKTINKQSKLGLWLGRAQRSGSLTERYINFFAVGRDRYELLGNPDLIAEVNNQIDITFEYRTKTSSVNIDIFSSYLQNNISGIKRDDIKSVLPSKSMNGMMKMVDGVRKFENIGDAFKTGFEFNWNQKLDFGINQHVSVSYTYGQDLKRDEPLSEIAPLDFRYKLSASYFKNSFIPELTFRYVLKQDRISNQYGEPETPSFTTLDLNIYYKFNKIIGAKVGVQNILNESYNEHLSRALRSNNKPLEAPGRNIFMSLTINLM